VGREPLRAKFQELGSICEHVEPDGNCVVAIEVPESHVAPGEERRIDERLERDGLEGLGLAPGQGFERRRETPAIG